MYILNFKFKFYEWIEDMMGMLLGVHYFYKKVHFSPSNYCHATPRPSKYQNHSHLVIQMVLLCGFGNMDDTWQWGSPRRYHRTRHRRHS